MLKHMAWMGRLIASVAVLAAQGAAADDAKPPADSFVNAVLINRDFHGKSRDMSGVKFDGAKFMHVNFSRTELKGASFRGALFITQSGPAPGAFSQLTPTTVFTHANLTGADFTDADLNGAQFVGATGLSSANFSGARLRYLLAADLNGAKLAGAEMKQCELYGAHLRGTDLSGADLAGACMAHADLRGANLRGADLGSADVRYANLRGADLTDAKVHNLDCDEADLRECVGLTQEMAEELLVASGRTHLPEGIVRQQAELWKPDAAAVFEQRVPLGHGDLRALVLKGHDLSNRELHWARLPADASGINFAESDMENCSGERLIAAGASFKGAQLYRVLLSGSDFSQALSLDGAQFPAAHLDHANFAGQKLVNVDFSRADLRGEKFTGCTFEHVSLAAANLQDADLREADLRGADLTDADLTGAKLSQAKLAGVNLESTYGLSAGVISQLASVDKELLPQRFRPSPPPQASPPGGISGRSSRPAGSAHRGGPFPLPELPPPAFLSRQVKVIGWNVGRIVIPIAAGLIAIRLLKGLARKLAEMSFASSEDAGDQVAPWAIQAASAKADAMAPAAGSGPGVAKLILSCFLLAFIVAGALVLHFGYAQDYRQCVASQNWKPAPCTISNLQIDNFTPDGRQFFPIGVHYHYTIDGATYESNRFAFGDAYIGSHALRQQLADVLAEGSPATCYVDPSNFGSAVLHRALGRHDVPLYVSTSLMAFGLLGFLAMLLSPRRRPIAYDVPPKTTRQRLEESRTAIPAPPASGASLTLLPALTRIRRTNGVIVLTVIVCTMLAIFVAVGRMVGFSAIMVIFIAVEIAAAIALFMSLIKCYRRLLEPAVQITFSRPLEPGRQIEVRWSFIGDAGRISGLSFGLEGTEEATYTHGTNTSTDKHVFDSIVFFEAQGGSAAGQTRAVLALPSTTMHTLTAAHNKINWVLKVSGQVAGGPPLDDAMDVTIYPIGAVP